MSTVVRCPGCAANLKVPEQALGRSLRCPRCKATVAAAAVVGTAAAIIESPAPAPGQSGDAPKGGVPADAADRPPPGQAPERKRRRRKKRKGILGRLGLPAVSVEPHVLATGISVLAVVLIGSGLVFGLRYALRTPPPPVIPAERWQVLEIPNRVKLLLPGTPERTQQTAAGVQIVMYMCQTPDGKGAYGAGYSENPLPAERRALPAETLLNDSCNGALANAQGGKQLRRESIQLGPYPGKQLVIDVPQASGKGILRTFYNTDSGRIYMVLAAGTGLEPDHENVRRLFDSFEILDDGKAPAPGAEPSGPKNPGGPAPEVAQGKEPPPPPPPAPLHVRPAEPLPIHPPALAAERVEVPLGGKVRDLCAGGGGRFLILHVPQKQGLAVFDVNEGKVVKSLQYPVEPIGIAAGMNKLFLADAAHHMLHRFDLTTFQLEKSVPLPGEFGTPQYLMMGSASAGPLVVARGSPVGAGGPSTTFLDTETLQPLTVPMRPGQVLPVWTSMQGRASPDGRVFLFHEGLENDKHDLKLLDLSTGSGDVSSLAAANLGYALPGDGGTVYTAGGVYTSRLTPAHPAGDTRLGALTLPAVRSSVYLRLWRVEEGLPPRDPKDRTARVTFHAGTQDQEVARLDGVDGLDEPAGTPDDRRLLTLDKRCHFIPDANLLITVPATYDRLILRHCDLDRLLEQSGKDYLLVTSRPPAEAVKGRPYRYAPAVHAKHGGVKVKLAGGPPGMVVRDDREVAWDVPADFADAQADVVLAVKDGAGQEVFHNFRVAVVPAGADEKQPESPRPGRRAPASR